MDPFSADDPGPLPATWLTASHEDTIEIACDWSDYRKDFGVSTDPHIRAAERRAFEAGWKAGRHGEQAGVLR
jgi:hypothetical protein